MVVEEKSVTASESYPPELVYHPAHDWARVQGDEAVLGITWFAQSALGDIVHFEPPKLGADLRKDETYGEVESVKAVSELVAPLSGLVVAVNGAVVEAPELVNEGPYGEGWLVRIRLTDRSELDSLLDAEQYQALIAEE